MDVDDGGNLRTLLAVEAAAGTCYVIMDSAFANPDCPGRGGALVFAAGVAP
jgi:hypothetical protein